MDVRTREQIASQTEGRIPKGATILPFDDWVGKMPPVLAGKKILLTCWKGNKRILGLNESANKVFSLFFFVPPTFERRKENTLRLIFWFSSSKVAV